VATELELYLSAVDEVVDRICAMLLPHDRGFQRDVLRRVVKRYGKRRKKRETLAQRLARKSLRAATSAVER
jgi:hypothetical protein